jgi:ubiquitin carboxyl-terminal hydrolase 26/29/37
MSVHRAGIRNLGNTCYIAALLQLFFSYTVLNTAISAMLTGRLAGSLRSLQSLALNSASAVSLLDFKRALDATCQRFQGHQQHDAHDFLLGLSDALQAEGHEHWMAPLVFTLASDLRVPSLYHSSSKSEDDYVLRLQLTHRLPCEAQLSVQTCLEAFFRGEELALSSGYKCPAGVAQRTFKQYRLQSQPPAFLIQLKRFRQNPSTGQTEKAAEGIKVNLSLDFSFLEAGLGRYRLAAAVVHLGQLRSGHYVTVCAPSSVLSEWQLFDDSQVHGLPFAQVQCYLEQASMLLYTV